MVSQHGSASAGKGIAKRKGPRVETPFTSHHPLPPKRSFIISLLRVTYTRYSANIRPAPKSIPAGQEYFFRPVILLKYYTNSIEVDEKNKHTATQAKLFQNPIPYFKNRRSIFCSRILKGMQPSFKNAS